jgi:hypothetical protein
VKRGPDKTKGREASPKNEDSGARPAPLRGWAKVFGFPKHPQSFGAYVRCASPDGKHALAFEPGLEYSMMRYQHQFRLVDPSKNVVQAFAGLFSAVQLAWWSPDSRIVAVPVDDQYGGLLLYDVRRKLYSLARFSPYEETVTVSSAGLRIAADRREFEAAFGTEFPPPPEIAIQFKALRWFPPPGKGPWKLREAFRSAPKAKWTPSREMKAYARRNGIELLNAT